MSDNLLIHHYYFNAQSFFVILQTKFLNYILIYVSKCKWLAGISSVGKGNGTDFTITVHHGRNISETLYKAQIWNVYSRVTKSVAQTSRTIRDVSSEMEEVRYCYSEYSKETDVLDIQLDDCPSISEDVRIKFHCSSSKVKKGYEKCAFYFW